MTLAALNDYTQAGDLFRLVAADEQDKLTSNIAGAMAGIPMHIQLLQIGHFTEADAKYGADVKRKLGL